MNICQFLHFNDKCPVCDTNLTTYMYVDSDCLWRSTKISDEKYCFRQFMLHEKVDYTPNDYMTLSNLDALPTIRFNTSRLGEDSKNWKLYFFKLCGNKAITDNKVDFDINWYEACYHRSSPWYQFGCHQQNRKKQQLELVNPTHKDLINRDESFCFKKMQEDGTETAYFLNISSEDNRTQFYSYSTTPQQRATPDFEPKCLEIENAPVFQQRPDFSLTNRDKLLNKFDTWIIFS